MAVVFVSLYLPVGLADGETSIRRFVTLQSPWERGAASNSVLEISIDGSRMNIRGNVQDNDLVSPGPRNENPSKENGNDVKCDRILVAWSHSPMALSYQGIEIFVDGTFEFLQSPTTPLVNNNSLSESAQVRVSRNANGFQLDCNVGLQQGTEASLSLNKSLYLSITQIDISRGRTSARWFCSTVPATLEPSLLHPSSFTWIDSFPADKPSTGRDTKLSEDNFRIAEIELRNKWNRYALDPKMLNATQKWYEDIAAFPDAERFLERSRNGNRMELIRSDDTLTPKRLTDARSETISQLVGQSWCVHISQIESLNSCLPLFIAAASGTNSSAARQDTTHTASLLMWSEFERLNVALVQNSEFVFWGSTNWPSMQSSDLENLHSISLVSDGSTIGIGFELYVNAIPQELVTHNANNLPSYHESSQNRNLIRREKTGDWEIRIPGNAASSKPQVDLYNTRLSPIEVLSLEPDTLLVSWSELTPEQREAWRLHYVFCVDPEGRYHLESLKHYTSSQAEMLRRSRKPAKK